jgi:ribosome-associated protein
LTREQVIIPTDALNEAVVRGILEKKGKNIVILDLRKLKDAVADYFIICQGDSSTQVKALADSVEEEVKKSLGERPWHIEGMENAQWVLVDYVNTVVHIFLPGTRDFYNIELLWNDAQRIDVPAFA